jgi:hypothetical protein
VKYGITQSLTADFTYNTDFAQVEADLQQVNLTPVVRRYFFLGALAYAEDGAGALETRDRDAEFAVEFQNGDSVQG